MELAKNQTNIFQIIKTWSITALLLIMVVAQAILPKPGQEGYDAEAQGGLIWYIVMGLSYFYLGFALLERLVTERYGDKYGGLEVLDCEVHLNKLAKPVDFYHLVESKDLLAISVKDFEHVLKDPLYEWCKNRVILEETIRRLETLLARMEEGKTEATAKLKANDDASLRALIEQVTSKKLSKQQFEEEIKRTNEQLREYYEKRELKEDGKIDAEGVRTFVYYIKLRDEDSFDEIDVKGKKIPTMKFRFILAFLPLSWYMTFNFKPGKINIKGYDVKVEKAKCAFVKVAILTSNTPTYKCTYCNANNTEQIDESISSQQIIDLQKLALARMVLELKHDMEDSQTDIRKFQARADYYMRKNDDIMGMYEEDVRPVDDYTTGMMQEMFDRNRVKKQKKTYTWVGILVGVVGVLLALVFAFKGIPVGGG